MSIFGELEKAGISVAGPGGAVTFNNPVLYNDGALDAIGRGKKFYLDIANGDDTYNGQSPHQAKATLAAALALMTDDNNDVLFIIGDNTGLTDDTQFTWDASGCIIVGIGPQRGGINKGVRIKLTDETAGGQFIVSGDDNTFINIQFDHQPSAATALTNVKVTGDNNTFIDCQFLNANNAASADEAGYLGLNLDGCDNASFIRCTIGGIETERTDGAADLTIGAGTISNLYMEDCIFIANLDAAADGDHAFIEQVADADLGDFAYLVRPTFINAGANAALPDAMTVGAATAGFWLIRDPLLVYITDIADNEEKVWVQNDGRDTTPGKFVGIAINPDVT